MKVPVVLIICNALDDDTRLRRRVHSDSPAASRKVLLMCQALRLAGARPYILSLGRGHPDGAFDWFDPMVRRVRGIPFVYAPFTHVPVISEVVSLFGLVGVLLRLSQHPSRVVVFYNRIPVYLPAMLTAVITRYRCIVDVEDGEAPDPTRAPTWRERLEQLMPRVFDKFCRDGALLACSSLAKWTTVRPIQCYYGTVTNDAQAERWQSPVVTCLLSGTLSPETGTQMLAEAIRALQLEKPVWARQLRFEITGKGPSLAEFKGLADASGGPEVVVHGRVSDTRYLEILQRCDVGLSLKPIGGRQADTTFPSKVIEFAGAGLLVLTTDISDVRHLLGEGARYITRNDSDQLVSLLQQVVEDRQAARTCAIRGRQAALMRCAPADAGRDLARFLLGRSV